MFLFQFTHPGRGATRHSAYSTFPECFNSRTPGGVRRLVRELNPGEKVVSIHAPREGCDGQVIIIITESYVSIHAPREGCDTTSGDIYTIMGSFNSRTPGGVRPDKARAYLPRVCFNSRTPGGVRLTCTDMLIATLRFQFTHPGRGATLRGASDRYEQLVSIHAPREGCDSIVLDIAWRYSGFNSRTPGGVRLSTRSIRAMFAVVSIHAPREGCDRMCPQMMMLTFPFQFTHPGRGATLSQILITLVSVCFNSRTPGGVRHEDYRNYTINFLFQFTHPGRGAT